MRLIDADEFLERFDVMCETPTDRTIACVLRGAIESQPTVYDIDKVEEDAENRMQRILDDEKNISYEQGRADVINEIKQITHDIFTQNLYCQEDMCSGEEIGYGCDDCLYAAIDSRLNKLKEDNSDT